MADSPEQVIRIAQNTVRSQRFLAAQARLYTDTKRIHDLRLGVVFVVALLTIVLALSIPTFRPVVGAVGGAIAFLLSVLAGGRERRRRREAAFVQEEFDTHVFQLPWNEVLAEHPSPTLVAEAAARYRGDRTKDWYADTRNVARPLDVLICQRSNLGWGSFMHRYYAAILSGLLTSLTLAGIALALLLGLSVADALLAILVPLLGPAREIAEMIRANLESAEAKSKAEAKVLALWDRAIATVDGVSIQDCRNIQDRILGIRQSNAHIPDWLDNLRRKRSESIMQASAEILVEEAIRKGRTQ